MYEWNRFQEAAAYLRAALEIPLKPDYYINQMNLYTWECWDLLSLIYYQLHEWDKARECWLEALKAAPNDARILANGPWFAKAAA
jgi:tetratricopeptide (TPR) repeat protein